MAFDDMLVTLGDFGLYQKIIYGLVFPFWFPAAANVLAVVFLAGSDDHWCKVSDWDGANCTGLGLNESECSFYKKHLSIPHTIADDDIIYDQCKKYDVSQVSFAEAMTYFAEYTNQSGDHYDVMPCDQGWEHGRELSAYTFTQSFDLVCDRKYLINLSQSIFFVGVLIGSVLLGAVADKYGRKLTLIIANVIVVVFGIGAAFSPNYIAFVVLRAIQAVGCFGMLLNSTVIGSEFVGPSSRAFVGIFISTSFSFGYLLLTFYAYFIRNWRYLLLTINLTFALFFFFYPFIPESVRWHISKGRYKEAEITVRKVAKFNKVKLTDDFFDQHNFFNKKEIQTVDKQRDATLFDLFRTPVLRKRTIVLIIVWMTNNLIYYGLHLSTGSFGIDIYLSFVVSGVVEIVSVLLCIPLIEWFGRRYTIIASYIVAGIASFIVMFVPAGAAKTTIAMIGKFGIAMSWAIGGIYVLEVLPTPTRSVGMGICSTASRVVAIGTPLLLLLYDVWAPSPLVLQTIAALVTAALCFILPETRGKKLPETLEDGETFGRKRTEDHHSLDEYPKKV